MITGESSPISSLVLILQSAQGCSIIGPRQTGSLVPILHLCQLAPMATQQTLQKYTPATTTHKQMSLACTNNLNIIARTRKQVAALFCYRNSHNYSPPMRKFLSSETSLRLLLFGNPVGLYVLIECVLIRKIGRGNPLCIFHRISLPQD